MHIDIAFFYKVLEFRDKLSTHGVFISRLKLFVFFSNFYNDSKPIQTSAKTYQNIFPTVFLLNKFFLYLLVRKLLSLQDVFSFKNLFRVLENIV